MAGVKNKKIIPNEEKYKVIEGEKHQICSICELFFPANFDCFYKTNRGGLYPYCKKCASKKADAWQKANKDKHKVSYTKQNNKPSTKERMRRYAKAQREQGKQKEWRQNNRDKLKQYGEERRMNKMHDFTNEQWELCKDYFNYSCAYCGIGEEVAKEQQGHYLHKEHVVHDGSNGIDNCVPSCRSCNSKKWKYDFQEWYRNSDKYTEERYDKIVKWLNEDFKLYIIE